jgi:hypothetical protein
MRYLEPQSLTNRRLQRRLEFARLGPTHFYALHLITASPAASLALAAGEPGTTVSIVIERTTGLRKPSASTLSLSPNQPLAAAAA